MAFIFGKKKTPKELLREYKRQIERTIRDIERERINMENQEKKTISEMKKLAQKNQMEAVKIMAKDIVRTRNYITKFYKMKAQLQSVALKLQTVKSTAEMTQAMGGAAKAMKQMNKRMDVPAMQNILKEFERQSEMMDMKGEIMDETLNDSMEVENEEEEQEGLVSAVLDEIGLDVKGQIKIKEGKIQEEEKEEEESKDDELQKRLDSLKK
jgi:charged multivesicular body protein 2A